MAKRAASRIHVSFGRGLGAIRAALRPQRGSLSQTDRAPSQLYETLESRVLLSATPPTVNLTWNGQSLKAFQGQYVAESPNAAKFQRFAAKQRFTEISSLGGIFYEFNSTLPVATLEHFSVANPLTFKALSPNTVQKLQSTAPSDASYPLQWGMNNTGQLEPYDYEGKGAVSPYNYVQNPITPPDPIKFPSPPYPNDNKVGIVGDDIQTQKAWDITTGSPDVVVAVLDTGIDLTHPDLIPNIWTNPLDTAANNFNGDGFPGDIHGWSFVTNSSDVTDQNGHGTNVAGIIGAAGNNGIGVTGVNWNVKLLPVQVFGASGEGSDATIISAINYVSNLKAHGINIVVMNESLGGEAFPTNVVSGDAIIQAGKLGILDVVAAGNSSLNLDNSFTNPAKFSVSIPTVITVAAVDPQFQLANFSNYGVQSVDLAAPGVNIYNTSPTYPVTLNAEVALEPDLLQFPENYGYLSGTSQATPSVTGIIALEAAANPSATPAQLKAALLGGTTYDPALDSVNGLPAKVATSGVANAYKAVLNILNYNNGSDAVRQGSWQGFYGSQGAYVVGESTTFPSVATVTTDGGTPVVIDNASNDPAALQRISDTGSRIAAYQASATTESINISFPDGLAHEVELYVADLNHQHRVETVNLIDTTSGVVLNSITLRNFTKGQYLNYDLRGPVKIQITNAGGPSAVYSGLFFDTAPIKPVTYVGTDTSTGGYNWRNQYGSQGVNIIGDTQQLPAYVTNLSFSGASQTVLRSKSRSGSSLQKLSDVSTGIQAYETAGDHLDINLSTNDTLVHTVTLYVADYDNKKRTERISVIDTATGGVLVTRDVSNFKFGQFVSFDVTGNVTFRVARTNGPTAVVSGIFFDAPAGENAHFVGTDTTTHGNWSKSQYGLTDAYILGDNFPGIEDVSNPAIKLTDATPKIVSVPSGDPAALYKNLVTPSRTRVAGYLYSNSTMSLLYTPTDLAVHQVALYFADYENYHRVETVTLTNPDSAAVLSTQVISNFRRGKYLIFDVTGRVNITITNDAYPNAVISGVFIN